MMSTVVTVVSGGFVPGGRHYRKSTRSRLFTPVPRSIENTSRDSTTGIGRRAYAIFVFRVNDKSSLEPRSRV